MRPARTLLALTLPCVVWWACTEGPGPTGQGGTAAVAILPSFQVDPALFESDPIDRIRLVAYDVATTGVVGMTESSVSPTAQEWALSLEIDLGGAATLDIIVEAELLSGTAVVWSGRLGPFTVPSPAPALALDVYRGPLDNQDVLSLSVVGAPAQLVAGSSVTLTALPVLVPGSTAIPEVFWASTDTSIATVSPEGLSVTLTGVAAGTVDVFAAAGSADFEFTVEVLALGAFSKVWVGGDTGGSPTDWNNAANWSPVGVPTGSDVVLVDATLNQPVLSGNAVTGSLTVGDLATVDLNSQAISVANDLDAGTTGGLTNGTVLVTGLGSVLEGRVDAIQILADRALSGLLQAFGDVTVTDADLDVNGHTLTLTGSGSLTVAGANAHLIQSRGGSINVPGNATFSGGDHSGLLTDVVFVVGGDFSVSNSSADGFPAGVDHRLFFNGGTPQSVVFGLPAASRQTLGTVTVGNIFGVSFDSDVFTTGDLSVSGRLVVAGGTTTTVAGTLFLTSGSQLQVDGTLTATGGCVDAGATITGSGTHPCGAPTQYTRVWVGGDTSGDPTDWDNPANWSPVGVANSSDTVLVDVPTNQPVLSTSTLVAGIAIGDQSSVDISTFNFQINNDVDAGLVGFFNGTVIVQGPGNVLQGQFDDLSIGANRSVTGPLVTLGALASSSALDINGQLVQVVDSLWLNGANAQLIMTDPLSTVVVDGNTFLDGGDHTGALTNGGFFINGDLRVTSRSASGFPAGPSHVTYFDGSAPQSVVFDLPGGGQQLGTVIVTNPTGTSFDSDVFTSGDVVVQGRLEVPSGMTTAIGGSITLDVGSELHVDGDLTAPGGCVNIGGTITGTGNHPCTGLPSADRVWVGGDVAGPTDWFEAGNWSPGSIPTSAETVQIPFTGNQPVLTGNASVAGLTVDIGATLDLGGFQLNVGGDLAADGQVTNGLTQLLGNGTVLQGAFDDLLIDADRGLSGALSTAGDLDVQRRLSIGPFGAGVGGTLFVQTASGELVLDNPAGSVFAFGDALFDGASLDGDLTDGILYVAGNFTAGTTESPTSFRSTGTIVYFNGTGDQTVTLTDAQQSFFDVSVFKPSGTLFFETDAVVTSNFFAENVTLAQSGATSLEVQGLLTLINVTLDGLPLRLVGGISAATHVMTDVTFTGMATDVTQFYVEVPGGGPSVPLVMLRPIFETQPTTGGYYIHAHDTGSVGIFRLVVQLTSPTPSTVSASEILVTGNPAEIIWGP